MSRQYSPFSALKITATAEWYSKQYESKKIQMTLPAEPVLVDAGVIDQSDPLDWEIDTDALDRLGAKRVADTIGPNCQKLTYTFTPVPMTHKEEMK